MTNILLSLAERRASHALEIDSRVATLQTEVIEVQENIRSGEIPFRKAYILSVVDRIEVDDGVVRIIGDKATLEQAIAGKAVAAGGVRRCVPKWRARRDSNS